MSVQYGDKTLTKEQLNLAERVICPFCNSEAVQIGVETDVDTCGLPIIVSIDFECIDCEKEWYVSYEAKAVSGCYDSGEE